MKYAAVGLVCFAAGWGACTYTGMQRWLQVAFYNHRRPGRW